MNDSNDTRNFIIDFWTLFFDGHVSLVPKIAFLVAVPVYLLSPIDVIPDVLLPLGLVDDGGFVIGAMLIFVRIARQQLENRSLMSEGKLKNDDVKFVGIPMNASNTGCSQVALVMLAITGALAFLVFAAIALSLLSGVLTVSGFLSSIGNLFGEPTTATVVPTRTIVNKLQPLGQLVTISAEVAQADIGVSVNTGGMNLCGHSANHVAQGVVEAGVDIAEIGEDSVSYAEDTDTYTLTLPVPSITSCRIEYIRQYERNGGSVACPIDWDNVRLLAQYEATTLFAADTLQAGILDRAKRETTLLMQSFVSALTDSKVEVVYSQADATPELPPSCQPQLPRGWRFDDEQNNWVKTE